MLHLACMCMYSSITELKSRLQHAEDELSLKNEAVLTLNHQLDDANTREEKLKKHCQVCLVVSV